MLTIFGSFLKKLKGILSSAVFPAVSAMMENIDLRLHVLIGMIVLVVLIGQVDDIDWSCTLPAKI